MSYQHAKIFKHKRKKIVLLLDKVVLSTDDLESDKGEFIFAQVEDKNINKTLYFVSNYKDYTQFKKDYKATLCGFWHTLFLANKIDLSTKDKISIVAKNVVYGVLYDGETLTNFFNITTENGFDVLSINQNSLNIFSEIISQADKVRTKNKSKNRGMFLLSILWLALFSVSYYFYQDELDSKLTILQKVEKIKDETSLVNNKIIIAQKDFYQINDISIRQIKKLLFLRFSGLRFNGEVKISEYMWLETSTDFELLKIFSKKHNLKLREFVEALPQIGLFYD